MAQTPGYYRDDVLRATQEHLTRLFWQKKAVADMTAFYQGAFRLPTLPDWILERVDLLTSLQFVPVYLWNRWLLIERLPASRTGDSRREEACSGSKNYADCRRYEIPEMMDRVAKHLRMPRGVVQLPVNASMLKDIEGVRCFLGQRYTWVNCFFWPEDTKLWVQDIGYHIIQRGEIVDRPDPEATAAYEVFLLQHGH
jgi:hypothetical protein